MSLTELRPEADILMFESLASEIESDVSFAFAAAAELSHGPYDTPEERAERVAVAGELGAAMTPGAPVLHELGPLDIRAGILVEEPKIITIGDEQAFEYMLRTADGEIQTNRMLFRSLVYGTRKGERVPMPAIAAGAEDITGMVAERYYRQREAEARPGGIPWNDMSPQTELYRYAVLAETGMRLADILAQPAVDEMSNRLRTHLANPKQSHNHPHLERALGAMEHKKTPVAGAVKRVMGWLTTNAYIRALTEE